MQAPNPIESPVIHTDEEPIYDYSCGCSATAPPGSRLLFMKIAAISMLVSGGLLYGLYLLMEKFGWL